MNLALGGSAAELAQFVFAPLPGGPAFSPNPDSHVNLLMVRRYPLAYVFAVKSFKKLFYLTIFLNLELPCFIKEIEAAKIDCPLSKALRR